MLLAALCCWGALGAHAQADVNVAVLGLRAPSGDDAIARDLTGSLRTDASNVEGWSMHSADVSLEQLMLVNGCDSPDRKCLTQIANSLKADRIISGTLRRVRRENKKGYEYRADVFYFNSKTKRIEKIIRTRIPKWRAKPEDLAAVSRRDVTRFAGKPPQEKLIEPAFAELDPDPKLTVVPAGSTAKSDDSKDRKWWPAAVMYTSTAAFFGLTAWNWATINNIEDDPDFQLARMNAGPTVSDVCTANSDFGVDDLDSLCKKIDRHETMQWVFLSAGIVSAGVGTWLLVRYLKSKKSQDRARLQLTPMAGKRGGGVSARFQF